MRYGLEHFYTRMTDTILDRLVHNAHQLNLKGDSMRKTGRFDKPAPSGVKPQSRPTPSRPKCPVCAGTTFQFAAEWVSSFGGTRSMSPYRHGQAV